MPKAALFCFHETLSGHGATLEIYDSSLTEWYRGPLKERTLIVHGVFY